MRRKRVLKKILNKFRRSYLLNKENQQLLKAIKLDMEKMHKKQDSDYKLLSQRLDKLQATQGNSHKALSQRFDKVQATQGNSHKALSQRLDKVQATQGNSHKILSYHLAQNKEKADEILCKNEKYYQDLLFYMPLIKESMASQSLIENEDTVKRDNPRRKSICLLNYTANSYHWGCFGTSSYLYDYYHNKGYYVHPITNAHLAIKDKTFIRTILNETDEVVINGEGSLHHFTPVVQGIFFAIREAKKRQKKVSLINHTLLLGGDEFIEEYKDVLSQVDYIAVRDTLSLLEYEKLGLNPVLSMDCLPAKIFNVNPTFQKKKQIVLASRVAMTEEDMHAFSKQFSSIYPKDYKIIFLDHQGIKYPAKNEKQLYDILKEYIPEILYEKGISFEDWLKVIGESELLISGRFHHTIAALSLSTPYIAWSSNTPKIKGLHQDWGNGIFIDDASSISQAHITQALNLKVKVPKEELLKKIVKNFM